MSHSNPAPIELDDLIAFNQEVAALVRAGIPLDVGLQGLAGDSAGGLATLAEGLAVRMERGMSLQEALSAEGTRIPHMYRAIVEVGIRSNRLPEALESTSRVLASIVTLRRRAGLALVYPSVVLWFAYLLFLAFLTTILQRFQDTFGIFRLATGNVIEVLDVMNRTLVWWCWIPPVLFLIAMWRWHQSARSRWLGGSRAPFPLSWIPGIQRLLDLHLASLFTQLLSTLVQNGVPWDEALILSADASGDQELQAGVRQYVRSSQSDSRAKSWRSRWPRYLHWILTRPEADQNADQLKSASEMYERRAAEQQEWIQATFPIVAVLGIGGTVTCLYTLVLLTPFIQLVRSMNF